MSSSEVLMLVASLVALIVLGVAFAKWDEGRIDRALKRKYPGPPPPYVPPPKPMTWDDKRNMLEAKLARDQRSVDLEAFWPLYGLVLVTAAFYFWLGWAGLLVGAVVGAPVYALLKMWISRHRNETAQLLAQHLQLDKSAFYSE
jgi:Flp pilus assembly protein TadB